MKRFIYLCIPVGGEAKEITLRSKPIGKSAKIELTPEEEVLYDRVNMGDLLGKVAKGAAVLAETLEKRKNQPQ